jgi:hypothetical protein
VLGKCDLGLGDFDLRLGDFKFRPDRALLRLGKSRFGQHQLGASDPQCNLVLRGIQPRQHIARFDAFAFFNQRLDDLPGYLGNDANLASRDDVALNFQNYRALLRIVGEEGRRYQEKRRQYSQYQAEMNTSRMPIAHR